MEFVVGHRWSPPAMEIRDFLAGTSSRTNADVARPSRPTLVAAGQECSSPPLVVFPDGVSGKPHRGHCRGEVC
jgi:hypothetical protein